MKLEELIKQLDYQEATWEYQEAKLRLAKHAIKVLPELVIAARDFQYTVLRNGQVSQTMISRLQKAIASSEEIPDMDDAVETTDKTTTSPTP